MNKSLFKTSTMDSSKLVNFVFVLILNSVAQGYEDSFNDNVNKNNLNEIRAEEQNHVDNSSEPRNPSDVFNGVYSECVFYLSYSCIQKKTLMYLNEMNGLDEVPLFGNYVKFVKVTPAQLTESTSNDSSIETNDDPKNLSYQIDDAVERFFKHHRLRFHSLGKDLDVARTVDEFVGRKRRKGGGGGGGDKGDGGKKKMMMMAMMCMKMKMMVMVPAMMGMMGMMSFKGMMFSMMSFMIAKMMLLMKILEKKGGGSGGGGGGDAGWAAGGSGSGGGGAWMPAGGGGGSSDGYGGPGGGYNAAGEWQSRSIPELLAHEMTPPVQIKYHQQPVITYVTPLIRYSGNTKPKKTPNAIKDLKDEIIKVENKENEEDSKNKKDKVASRKKRGIMDLINYVGTILKNNVFQSDYKALANQLNAYPKYRIINGVKYVYYPQRYLNRLKYPKMMPTDNVKPSTDNEVKPIVTLEDFNKGEIVDEVVEGRMNRKKMQKMKETVKDVVEDNPWE